MVRTEVLIQDPCPFGLPVMTIAHMGALRAPLPAGVMG